DLGAARAAVSPPRPFSGEAFGDRRHIDLTPDLRLRDEARADHPAHQDLSGSSLKWQPADRLDGAGRLPDEHHAVVGIPAQHRGGLSEIASLDASGTRPDLTVELR